MAVGDDDRNSAVAHLAFIYISMVKTFPIGRVSLTLYVKSAYILHI